MAKFAQSKQQQKLVIIIVILAGVGLLFFLLSLFLKKPGDAAQLRDLLISQHKVMSINNTTDRLGTAESTASIRANSQILLSSDIAKLKEIYLLEIGEKSLPKEISSPNIAETIKDLEAANSRNQLDQEYLDALSENLADQKRLIESHINVTTNQNTRSALSKSLVHVKSLIDQILALENN